MRERYSRVVDFETSLQNWTQGLFLKERELFGDIAEWILEGCDYVPKEFPPDESDKKSVTLMLVARLFNDFESAKILILSGLCEQAYMPMRDSIECMMLIRLFEADGERALRWVTRMAEYHPGDVKARLDELGVEAPEHAFYGVISMFGHANLAGSVMCVRETQLGDKQWLRQYHFGGYSNYQWIGKQLQSLVVMTLFGCRVLLHTVFKHYVPTPEEWNKRVTTFVERLKDCGVDIGFYWDEKLEDRTAKPKPTRVDRAIIKLQQKLFDMGLINEAETDVVPSADGHGVAGKESN